MVDSLTGLLRGGGFESSLDEMIRKSPAKPHAVFVLGLNRFRRLNQLLGYEAGDEGLAELSARLRKWLPEGGVASRLGGDEFGVALPMCGEREAAAAAESILLLLEEGLSIQRRVFHLTAGVGMSCYPSDGSTSEELLRRASAAMDLAKMRGGNAVERNGRGERLLPEERFRLETALRLAMVRDELSIRYQPQIDREGALRGFEALLVWNSADLGRVHTETFIKLAEETGAIITIGIWVLERACRQVMEWRREGLEVPRVAVNVSPQQFSSPSFVATVRRVLAWTGLPGESLELEITESSILQDIEEAARRMTELRALGVRIAIDDFGVGYSPLAYLHKLPLDTVKVDRSFVGQITKPSGSLPVVHTITVMAHHRGLQVVAEGVETEAELELVRAARCDLVQGYLIGTPMTVEDVTTLLGAPEGLAVHAQARSAVQY